MMKIIIVIKNILKMHRQLSALGFGHKVRAPKSIVCDHDLKAIAAVLAIQNVEITVVAIGGNEVEPALEYCLALGANKAVKLDPGRAVYNDLDQANMLYNYLKDIHQYALVFGYNSTLNVAPMLASLLECKQLHLAFEINFDGNNFIAKHRNGADIVETIFEPPVVISIASVAGDTAPATLYDLMRVNAEQIETIAMPITNSCNIEQSYEKHQDTKTCNTLANMEDLHGLLKIVEIL